MKLIGYLQERPLTLLALLILIVCLFLIIISRESKNNKIIKAAQEMEEITNSIQAGIVHFIYEDNCKILYASKGFYDMLGYSEGDPEIKNKRCMMDFIFEDDKEKILNVLSGQKSKKICFMIRLVLKDGGLIYCLVNGNKTICKDNKHKVSIVLSDFTEQEEMQARLFLERERYRVAAELSNDVLFEYDILKDTLFFMGRHKEFLGRDSVIADFFKRLDVTKKLINSKDVGIYQTFCRDLKNGKELIKSEFRMKDKFGEYIWCQVRGKTIYGDDGNPLRVIGTIVNINMHKREHEALEYMATRDPLTGIYNKEATEKKIDMFIKGNKEGKHALLFLDFDDFKKINDNYGHLKGDEMLRFIVEQIKSVFKEGEIIGRVGGDEFVVFAGNLEGTDAIIRKAELLHQAVDTTYEEEENLISVTASIGIACYPNDGGTYVQLVDCADRACYEVKADGKNNYKFFRKAI